MNHFSDPLLFNSGNGLVTVTRIPLAEDCQVFDNKEEKQSIQSAFLPIMVIIERKKSCSFRYCLKRGSDANLLIPEPDRHYRVWR